MEKQNLLSEQMTEYDRKRMENKKRAGREKVEHRKETDREGIMGGKGAEKIRLNKFLSSRGVCSRREADRLIMEGLVTVNGLPGETGQGVSEEDIVLVRGERVSGKAEPVVLAYHKPAGVICSERDAHADKLITEMIDYPVRLTYAGRLDKDSTGLILMTNDGDLIDGMMRGANRHEKEYIVTVKREITPEFLESMEQGVYLKDLHVKTRKCRLKKLDHSTFSIILTQGLNKQIRRMCKACGNPVASIKRVRIMNILLGDLKENEWREIGGEEKRRLYELSGQKRQNAGAGRKAE